MPTLANVLRALAECLEIQAEDEALQVELFGSVENAAEVNVLFDLAA